MPAGRKAPVMVPPKGSPTEKSAKRDRGKDDGDLGRGFDVEAALRGKGLGLTRMSERDRLVNGMIAIESKPIGGTAIHVCALTGVSATSSEKGISRT